MDVKNLTYLLENPEEISLQQTQELENILRQTPYFQAARAIRLKGLKDANSPSYNSALKKTAAYTADREMLFDYISSESFNQNKLNTSKIQKENELFNVEVYDAIQVLGNKSMEIGEAIRMKLDESKRVFDPELFRTATTKKSESPKEETPQKILKLGTPLEFNNSESHSFSEWLRLTTAKPLPKKSAKTPKKIQEKFDIIDKFIAKNPKIKPSKPKTKANLADVNTTTPEALMTETLARVYLEQKNYKKAIQAYKILILKNPEKSGFFADQIRAVEKLQENNLDKE
ncbi:hypothetical protein [Zunongwangia sp.]|uniref:hypothetical protein n=1 Tax=Zunongwangia sp. TaxID=1965325 RepID=UPI003AA8F874